MPPRVLGDAGFASTASARCWRSALAGLAAGFDANSWRPGLGRIGQRHNVEDSLLLGNFRRHSVFLDTVCLDSDRLGPQAWPRQAWPRQAWPRQAWPTGLAPTGSARTGLAPTGLASTGLASTRLSRSLASTSSASSISISLRSFCAKLARSRWRSISRSRASRRRADQTAQARTNSLKLGSSPPSTAEVSATGSVRPHAPGSTSPRQFDNFAATKTRRRRDKRHREFVAAQACVICGSQPSDAHHLRFAQPRGLSLKVSDEFTVPLCRPHHRDLHRASNEIRWWAQFGIQPMSVAYKLWNQTHPVPVSANPAGPDVETPAPAAAAIDGFPRPCAGHRSGGQLAR